jgi:hypothetical protein
MYTTYDRNSFVIAVKALAVWLVIASQLFHSFFPFVIICALWFINILSGV